MKPVIRPRARDDIIRQFRWYLVEQDAPEAAFRFLGAVQASIKQFNAHAQGWVAQEAQEPGP